MVKTFKLIFAALLVSFGATALAQCMPMNAPGPPRIWDGARGCYVPQGTPDLQSSGGFVNNGGVFTQQTQCPDGSVWDGRGCLINNNQQQWQQTLMQQAIRIPMGQQVPQGYCSWGGRTENVLTGALLGAVIGVIAGDNRESARKGAGLGALAGVFVPCDSLQQSQRVVVQQQQVVQNQQVLPPCRPPQNPAGSRPGVLNLPGNEMDGKTVCAMPGDTNISRWL